MKNKQIISIGIAATLSITTLKLDKVEANPITAPACKDVPSCIVTGTVVVGGIVYYVLKNTVTGVVHRVPASQLPPSHRVVEPGRHNVGDKVTLTGRLVSSREKCEEEARKYGERTDGGEWAVIDYEVVGGGPERVDRYGNVEYTPIRFRCVIQKVR